MIPALLNWRWARNGGPKDTDEKAIFYTVLIAGVLGGFGFYKAEVYPPLGSLWFASLSSAAACCVS